METYTTSVVMTTPSQNVTKHYQELPPLLHEQVVNSDEMKCRPIFRELKKLIKFGILDRKKHWNLFQRGIRIARQTTPTREEIAILHAVDKIFYERWKVPRVSLGKGTVLFLLVTIILESTYVALLNLKVSSLVASFAYIILTFSCIVFTHCIEHYIIGRSLGIRFYNYFFYHPSFRKVKELGGILRFIGNKAPTIGIKYQLDSFLKAEKWKRTLMLAIPHFFSAAWLITNYFILLQHYSLKHLAILFVTILSILYILGTLWLSYFRYGDLWKARIDYPRIAPRRKKENEN